MDQPPALLLPLSLASLKTLLFPITRAAHYRQHWATKVYDNTVDHTIGVGNTTVGEGQNSLTSVKQNIGADVNYPLDHICTISYQAAKCLGSRKSGQL